MDDGNGFAAISLLIPQRPNKPNYLGYLRELLPDLPLVAELRHYTWSDPQAVEVIKIT